MARPISLPVYGIARVHGLFAIALAWLWILHGSNGPALADDPAQGGVPRVAAITTCYYHNSHADLIAGRLLETHSLDSRGRRPKLKLVSLYVDQFPENDKSRRLCEQHGVRLCGSIREALELGTGALAVDGVLLIAEHGRYPVSDTGQTVYPKRRFFTEVADVFQRHGRAAPMFFDKQLADNWDDAMAVYDRARELQVPLLAGSVLPIAYRRPAVDLRERARLKEIVCLSYHSLDGYGFHALEVAQALAERRSGGETGIARVRTLVGDAAWQSIERGEVDRGLLNAAIGRLSQPPDASKPLKEQLFEPATLFRVEYVDGLLVHALTANYAFKEWAAAWRYADDHSLESTLLWTQEERPLSHFTPQVDGIEQLIHTGRAPWPAERTLLTSGILDRLLISKRDGGKVIETPELKISYTTDWSWKEPEPPAPGRPLGEQ